MNAEQPLKKFAIRVVDDESIYACAPTQKVLSALKAEGAMAAPWACPESGCGFCRVRVLSGIYATGTINRARLSEEEERRGIALICCLYPRSDLLLEAVAAAAKDD